MKTPPVRTRAEGVVTGRSPHVMGGPIEVIQPDSGFV